jgi:hypothetical protein
MDGRRQGGAGSRWGRRGRMGGLRGGGAGCGRVDDDIRCFSS